MNDSARAYRAATDTVEHLLTISDYNDSTKKWRLHYSYPLTDSLILWGTRFKGPATDSIRIAMARFPLNKFRLNARGFNWINEFPNNR
jgi:hypothetical protein